MAIAYKNNIVNILAFGAVGDGVTDNTTSIQSALDYAKVNNLPVFVPSGSYAHSGILTIDSIYLFGEGDSSVFLSTNTTGTSPNNSVKITGQSPALKNIKVSSSWAGTRQSNINAHAVQINAATDFYISNVFVYVSAASGIFTTGSSSGIIDGCRVDGTFADGIHTTGGSSGIVVTNNNTYNTGDDAVSVVSYNTDASICSNITISSNNVKEGPARGITVVGGKKVKIVENDIQDFDVSGIYIASEAGFNTKEVIDIIVSDNMIANSNRDVSNAAAGVYVQGRLSYNATGILVSNNVIVDCNKQGIAITSSDGTPSYTKNIKINGNMLRGKSGASDTGIGLKLSGVTNISIVSNDIQDFHANAIYSDASKSAGFCQIVGNTFSNLNLANVASTDAVYIGAGTTYFSIVTFDANIYMLGTYAVERFIEADTAIRVIFGQNNYAQDNAVLMPGRLGFGSITWNPGSLVDGAGETSSSITVPGTHLGDGLVVGAPYDLQDMTATAYLTADGVAEIRLQNESGATVDLGSGNWYVYALKRTNWQN